jgi:hypothetical protein
MNIFEEFGPFAYVLIAIAFVFYGVMLFRMKTLGVKEALIPEQPIQRTKMFAYSSGVKTKK